MKGTEGSCRGLPETGTAPGHLWHNDSGHGRFLKRDQGSHDSQSTGGSQEPPLTHPVGDADPTALPLPLPWGLKQDGASSPPDTQTPPSSPSRRAPLPSHDQQRSFQPTHTTVQGGYCTTPNHRLHNEPDAPTKHWILCMHTCVEDPRGCRTNPRRVPQEVPPGTDPGGSCWGCEQRLVQPQAPR